MSEPFDISHLMIRSQQMNGSAQRLHNRVQAQTDSLDAVCRDFEALFVGYMLQQMRQTVSPDGLFGGGRAEEMYTSMLDNEIAKSVAKEKSIGLAPILNRQLTALTSLKKNE